MRDQIVQQSYDEERALYGLRDTDVVGCTFAGDADGESALKECRGITRGLAQAGANGVWVARNIVSKYK